MRPQDPGARSAGEEEEVGSSGEQLHTPVHLPSSSPPAEGLRRGAAEALPADARAAEALGAITSAQARGPGGERSAVPVVL